jgi:PST family polysaccharide transporter
MWFASSTALRSVLRIVVTGTLARILTPADFGVIAAASIFIVVAELFSTPGVVFTLVQRRELEQRHIGSAFVGTLLTAFAVALAVVALAPWIAGLYGMPTLGPVLQVLAVLLPLNAVSSVSQKLLERAFIYHRIAMIDVISYVCAYAALSLPLAALGFGVWSLVYAQIGSAALRSLLVFLSQPHNPVRGASLRAYLEMMRVGVGFSVARYANVAANKGDYLVVGKVLGASQLGYYERAYLLMDLSNNLLTNTLSTVLFSAFSRLQDDRAALGRAYLRCSATLALIFCPASVAAAILAPEVIAVLLGDQWDAAVLPFRILALGMFFRTGFKIASMLINSVGAVYRNAAAQVAYATAVIGGALLTYRWGIAGVAASTLFGLGVIYTLNTRTALRETRLRWSDLFRVYRPALIWCGLARAGARLHSRQAEMGASQQLAPRRAARRRTLAQCHRRLRDADGTVQHAAGARPGDSEHRRARRRSRGRAGPRAPRLRRYAEPSRRFRLERRIAFS